MSLIKFIFYSLIAFLVIRFIMRLFSPPANNRPQNNQTNTRTKTNPNMESLDKPKFTIEAESVDYEVVEEPKDKNEE